MSSFVMHILSIISIYILVAGLAFVRLRLWTSMKTKTIIIFVASTSVIGVVVVILYLYFSVGF